MLEGTNINWTNCWRGTFIILLLAAFFGCIGWGAIGNFLGFIGGIAFIIMLVIRFDDFTEFMDSGNRRSK